MRNPNGFITHDSIDGVNKHRCTGRLPRAGNPYPGCELLAVAVVIWAVALLVARVLA